MGFPGKLRFRLAGRKWSPKILTFYITRNICQGRRKDLW